MNYASIFKNTYIFSALLSQLVSNVPATVFVSGFTAKWFPLSAGVNIAAQGTIIASMANIIGVRLSGGKKMIFIYHFFAIPFFIISFVFCYILIFLISCI
jgi:Na+/H+ antiporter NhaD/arsenite permease-like protein